MNVILFDIDGTLIRSGGAGKRAMEQGLKDAFGIGTIQDVVPYGGRTDVAIVKDLLTVHDIPVTPENEQRVHQLYQTYLHDTLRELGGEVLPAIAPALDRLSRAKNVSIGLLTGNVLRGAETKLRYFGLWDYFPFGGFADGLADRNLVARRAYEEAEKYVGRAIPGENVWVIGDTPHDVTCAKFIQAKSVAVQTGGFTHADLSSVAPDHIFRDFSEAEPLLDLWCA